MRKAEVKCPLPCGYAVLNESHNMEWHVSVESGTEQELVLVYILLKIMFKQSFPR